MTQLNQEKINVTFAIRLDQWVAESDPIFSRYPLVTLDIEYLLARLIIPKSEGLAPLVIEEEIGLLTGVLGVKAMGGLLQKLPFETTLLEHKNLYFKPVDDDVHILIDYETEAKLPAKSFVRGMLACTRRIAEALIRLGTENEITLQFGTNLLNEVGELERSALLR